MPIASENRNFRTRLGTHPHTRNHFVIWDHHLFGHIVGLLGDTHMWVINIHASEEGITVALKLIVHHHLFTSDLNGLGG